MALFTNDEFSIYAQTTIAADNYALLLELVTGLIEDVTGLDYDTDTPTTTVKAVALEAAARAYRNPKGLSSKSEAIGEYSYTDRWEGATAQDFGVFLTAGETARLRGVPRNRSVVLQTP